MAPGKKNLEFNDPKVGIQIPSGAHGNVSVSCPRCIGERKKKNTKTLYVDVDQGVWKCEHCGRTGSLTRGWVDAPVEEFGVPVERVRTYSKPPVLPPAPVPTVWDKVVAYVKSRGIDKPVLERNRVVVQSMYCRVCEKEHNHIGFPYYRRGEHINTKWRCPEKHFRMETNAERIMYGYDDVVSLAGNHAAQPIILVEGEFDKFALEQAGFTRVLSVPNGAPSVKTKNYETALNFLDDPALLKAFEASRRIIIAVDADEPGEKLQNELVRRCRPEFCKIVTWPDGIKDANEALKEMGADGLRSCIDSAESPPIEGIVEPQHLTSQIERYYREGLPRGIGFGWPIFDPYIRLIPGGFYVLQAIPQSGKSSFVTALLLKLAEQADCQFAVCSPEWQPVAVHEIAMLEVITGKPFEGPGRMTPEEMHAAEDWLQRYCSFIMPEKKSVDVILDRARALAFRRGIRVLVIDPWTELEHEYGNAVDKLAYIGQSLSKMREFGQKHGIAVILIVHPTKPQRKVLEDGRVKYEPLGMYGAAHSADFTNKADFIIELEREGGEDTAVHVHIQKVRFKWSGQMGRVTLYFDRATGRYSETRQYEAMPTYDAPPSFGEVG